MKQNSICKPLMIQGTASSSGKSLLVTALCRILYQNGIRVAPFKAQNMSNNSFVTGSGEEMGRAQVVQAFAAGLVPDIRMNPVLLKPGSDTGSQVILRGKPAFNLHARNWHSSRDQFRETIRYCYESLIKEYDAVLIEGAGSPAEINLKDNDIVNMGMARMADAPVIIVGDIDRGGVFASLVGTMQLLDEDEKKRVKGFIINKFRGDVDLLAPGLRRLEAITERPVLGVVPWVSHCIDEEDGESEWFGEKYGTATELDICIIRLPHIANYTDFQPLQYIAGVGVRWCDSPDSIGRPDIVIVPGTKATVADLQMLKKSGMAQAILSFAHEGGLVFGICGGFQMLGTDIRDDNHSESVCRQESGLGLLEMKTSFRRRKVTSQIRLTCNASRQSPLWECHEKVGTGYEIHMGKSTYGDNTRPFTYSTDQRDDTYVSGIGNRDGTVVGTYVHGFFDSPEIATGFINSLRKRKGLEPIDQSCSERAVTQNHSINKVADIVRSTVDMEKVYAIAGLQ